MGTLSPPVSNLLIRSFSWGPFQMLEIPPPSDCPQRRSPSSYCGLNERESVRFREAVVSYQWVIWKVWWVDINNANNKSNPPFRVVYALSKYWDFTKRLFWNEQCEYSLWERQKEGSEKEGISLNVFNEFLTQCSVPEDNSCIEIPAAALNETPGEQYVYYTGLWMANHFGSRATTAFGDWMLWLECEDLHLGCGFFYTWNMWKSLLQGNSTLW